MTMRRSQCTQPICRVTRVTLRRITARTGRVVVIRLIILAMIAAGCRSTEPGTPASVIVTPADLIIEIGEAAPLSASVPPANGATLPIPAPSWSSDQSSIAEGGPDGRVTGRAVGSTVVRAAAVGVSGSAKVTVTAARAATIRLSANSDTLAVHATRLLILAAFDAGGAPLEVPASAIAWASSDPGTVSVAPTLPGLVTGIAPGSATVTATINGVSARAPLVVLSVLPLASGQYRLRPDNVFIVVGGTHPLRVRLVDRLGQVIDFPFPIAWSSSAPSIATVSSAGLVTAVGPGTATLTAATDSGSVTASVRVGVSPAAGLVTSLVSGFNHACALTSTGVALCWGVASELGGGRPDSTPLLPQPVATSLTFASLAPGMAQHSCGLTSDGAAYCWGRNDAGHLGDGSVRDQLTPVPILFRPPLGRDSRGRLAYLCPHGGGHGLLLGDQRLRRIRLRPV